MTSSSCRLEYSLFDTSWKLVESKHDYTDCVAYCYLDSDGEQYLLLTKGPHSTWTDVPNRTLKNKLRGRQKSLPPPILVAMASDGRYYVEFEDGVAQWCGSLGDHFGNIIRKSVIRAVSFGAGDTAAIVKENGAVCWYGRPHEGVLSVIRKDRNRKIQCVGLNPENANSYIIGFEDGGVIGYGSKVLTEINKQLRLAPDEYVKSAHLGSQDTYVIQIAKKAAPPPPPPVRPTAPMFDVSDTLTVGIKLDLGRFYFGPVRNGKQRHGRGVCVYDSTSPYNALWVAGTFVADCLTSKCSILETKSGDVYRGVLVNGQKTGSGSIIGGENSDYSHCGGFVTNKACGLGVRIFTNGKYSIGCFDDDKLEGQALTVFRKGDAVGTLFYCGRYTSDTIDDLSSIVYEHTPQPPLTPTLSEMDFCTRIVARALQLLHGSDLFSITRTADISANNKALCSFIRGLRVLRDDLLVTDEALPLDGVFAWHGTNAAAIDSIMDNNFDTRLRRLQNQGPGEYLAYNYQDALAFAKDNNLLVLTYTPRGPHLATTEDFCVVVKNPPTHSNIAFILPVLVVKVGDNAPRFTHPKWGLRWQFCFQGDGDQQWIPYTPQVNAILCEAICSLDPSATTTRLIRCLKMSDGTTETYEINLSNRTQRNIRTNFVRAIRFVKVPAIPLGDAPSPPLY